VRSNSVDSGELQHVRHPHPDMQTPNHPTTRVDRSRYPSRDYTMRSFCTPSPPLYTPSNTPLIKLSLTPSPTLTTAPTLKPPNPLPTPQLNLSRPVASSRRRSRRVKPQEWDTDSAALSLLSCSSAGSLGVVNEDEEGNGGGEGAVAEEAVAEEAVVEEEVEEEVELGVLEEETPSIVYRQV